VTESELVDAMATILLDFKDTRIRVQTLANSYSGGRLENVLRGWIVLETGPEQFEYIALCHVARWWPESEEDDDEGPVVITEADLIAELQKVDREMAGGS
jgi:hypothetical protein